ncbi:MAG: CoA-binding protein [Bacteroidota bacterium]
MGSGSGLACDLTLNSSLTPELRARYQDAATVRRILGDAKTIAIIGLSTNPQKASQFVATYLKYHGYRIIPVHPKAATILGETVYPSLAAIPEPVDVVCAFRPPAACPGIAEEAAAIGAKALWLQLGIASAEAGEIAEAAGLDVVMDRCLKMEHGRYSGTMHWVGMNTGLLTAKRARSWV